MLPFLIEQERLLFSATRLDFADGIRGSDGERESAAVNSADPQDNSGQEISAAKDRFVDPKIVLTRFRRLLNNGVHHP
jgi:hypothetical protein